MSERGRLADNAAVVTVMTNIGFSFFAKENGIKMITTKVGDRYILEQMLAGGYSLGGEQSGHIISVTLPPPATVSLRRYSCFRS